MMIGQPSLPIIIGKRLSSPRHGYVCVCVHVGVSGFFFKKLKNYLFIYFCSSFVRTRLNFDIKN
jgi:hypothetical protein